jgi:hypothetical protein
LVTEVDKLAPSELGAIVGNDHVHDPIPVYYLLDELDCCLGGGFDYRLGLDPLGELLDHNKQVIEALGCSWEFPNKVESLNSEGPCDWDSLEFLGGDVFSLSKILTSIASPHDMLCILNHGGPVESLSKGLSHQGVWSREVTTSP